MKKAILLLITIILITNVIAHGEEDFAKAEEIIKSKISCKELSDEQLELIGGYYMEQMHPGELHEIMDERMGGEGSVALKQVHINMAKSFYCGESMYLSGGMMNMMMNRQGMMFNNQYYAQQINPYYNAILAIFMIILIIAVIILVLLIIKKPQGSKK